MKMPKDITEKRFGHLTALYPTEKRDSRGYVIWHCKCDCGAEVEINYNSLCHGNLRSCGCQKKEQEQNLHNFLTHIAGTSIDLLKSQKIPKNNTSGVRGVYLIRGKYVAKIVFQKKQYILGHFDRLEDAAAVRQKCEVFLRDEVLDYYEQWQKRAAADPQWAIENPVQIKAEKDGEDFRLTFLPLLPAK